MIRLVSLKIVGFKNPKKTVNVRFSSESISVIYGENGCGKTTLLKIIYALLSHNEAILLEEKISEVQLNYMVKGDGGNGFIIHQLIVRKSENDEKNYDWDGFDREELIDSSSILFGVQRGITTSHTKIEPEIIERIILRNRLFREMDNRISIEKFSLQLSYHLNEGLRSRRTPHSMTKSRQSFHDNHLLLDSINIETIEGELLERYRLAKRVTSERVQKALFDTLSLAILNPKENKKNRIDQLPQNFPELLEKNKERLIEALKASAENTFRDHIISFLKSYDTEDLISRNSKDQLLPNLLFKMMLELESDQYILNSINDLIEVFNDQISKWKRLVVNQDEAYIDLGENNRHSLSELSSGERHLLSFLTLFIIKGGTRNFLIIDEPEISLNIKWQRQLLPLLSKLVPNAQIIVASHSASIAKANSNYLVRMEEEQ